MKRHAGGQDPFIAKEATGGLHRAWTHELNRCFLQSVPLFGPSETAAARAQLGSRRSKTDDRDCAALTDLARQGHGRSVPADEHEALLSAVRFRRSLLIERKAAQQRLHDQVNGLCPGGTATRKTLCREPATPSMTASRTGPGRARIASGVPSAALPPAAPASSAPRAVRRAPTSTVSRLDSTAPRMATPIAPPSERNNVTAEVATPSTAPAR